MTVLNSSGWVGSHRPRGGESCRRGSRPPASWRRRLRSVPLGSPQAPRVAVPSRSETYEPRSSRTTGSHHPTVMPRLNRTFLMQPPYQSAKRPRAGAPLNLARIFGSPAVSESRLHISCHHLATAGTVVPGFRKPGASASEGERGKDGLLVLGVAVLITPNGPARPVPPWWQEPGRNRPVRMAHRVSETCRALAAASTRSPYPAGFYVTHQVLRRQPARPLSRRPPG
jgi:hypothetical protein